MTPDQLLTFAAVVEHGSVGRAADALHLSQPAVSGQLRLLQKSFGEPLYRREGRGIRLTPAGEQLGGLARSLRQTYDRARTLREALAGLSTGSLAIGASTTPASYLMPYVVAAFRARHPTVSVALSSGNTSDVVGDLARFDLAFIEGDVPAQLPADTAVHAWRRDEVVAIVPTGHPLAASPADGEPALGVVGLAELAACPLVLREAGSGVRRQVSRAFEDAGLTMRVALEVAGVEGVREAVRAGLGVGFVSAMAVRHDAASLVPLHVGTPAGIGRHITVLVPHASAPSSPARAFLDVCFTTDGHPPRIQSHT